MPIKFRRIEDRKQSVMQLRRREVDTQARRHMLPKLLIAVVILIGASAVYLYWRPPSIVAPFLIHVDPVLVCSPISGTVEWLIDGKVAEVHQGDVIARITPGPQGSGSPTARLTELQLRTDRAAAELKTQQAAREKLESDLTEQQRQLKSEVDRAAEQLTRADTDLQEARNTLDGRHQDFETAQRLKRLGALTEHDYLLAERAHSTAGSAYEKAQSHARSLKGELAVAKESFKEFQKTRQSTLAAADARIEGALSSREGLRQAVEPQASALFNGADHVVVRATTSGRLLEVHTGRHSHVQPGEAIVTLYEPETAIARAFVATRYRDRLKEGASARLYLVGRDAPLVGKVVRIHDGVVPLPSSLQKRLGYRELHKIPTDIRLTDSASSVLFAPGEAGKAVIEIPD